MVTKCAAPQSKGWVEHTAAFAKHAQETGRKLLLRGRTKSSHHIIAPQWSGCTGRGGYDVVPTLRPPTRRGNFLIRLPAWEASGCSFRTRVASVAAAQSEDPLECWPRQPPEWT
eukprot:gene20555-biopygen11607